MYHVFQVLPLDFSRNFSKPKGVYREEARNFPKSLRLYEEPQPIWMESSEFFQVPGYLYIGRKLYTTTRTSLHSVLRSSKSQSQGLDMGGGDRNFSKSHSLFGESSGFFQVSGSLYYREENVYDDSHLPSRSHNHIVLHIVHMFLHIFSSYFFIFLYILQIFLHIDMKHVK